MTFTYTGDPANNEIDRVRFMIGDTNPDDGLLTDSEISYLLAKAASPEEAAYKATGNIIAKLAREVDYQIGPEKVSASQMLLNFQKLRQQLSKHVTTSTAFPLMSDPSGRPGSQPIFDIGMNDAPGVGFSNFMNRLEGRGT